MKKLFSLLAMILCAAILSISVFAEDNSAYAVYQSYRKAMKNVKAMELSGTYNDSMQFSDGLVSNQRNKIAVKSLITPDKQLQMSWKCNFSVGSIEETIRNYLKDDWLYASTSYERSKYETGIGKTNMLEMLSNGFILKSVYDFNAYGLDPTKEELAGAKLENITGGSKITFKLDRSIIYESYSYSDKVTATVSITIGDDGILQTYSETGTRTLGYDNDPAERIENYTMKFKVKSIDAFDSISFPSDLNTYKE